MFAATLRVLLSLALAAAAPPPPLTTASALGAWPAVLPFVNMALLGALHAGWRGVCVCVCSAHDSSSAAGGRTSRKNWAAGGSTTHCTPPRACCDREEPPPPPPLSRAPRSSPREHALLSATPIFVAMAPPRVALGLLSLAAVALVASSTAAAQEEKAVLPPPTMQILYCTA
ncbi:hypothetical protein EON62_00855 [archaeon]|nr:MAG: hypothetical protein EON62_00855 [archaeon]